MNNSSPHLSVLRGVLACLVAVLFSSCVTTDEPQSLARVQQLQSTHLTFIDTHTSAAAPASWDQSGFDSSVGRISQMFTQAAVADSKVTDRRKFVENSSILFQGDASRVQKNHFLSPGYAKNRKSQIQQNYDLLLAPATPVATGAVSSVGTN